MSNISGSSFSSPAGDLDEKVLGSADLSTTYNKNTRPLRDVSAGPPACLSACLHVCHGGCTGHTLSPPPPPPIPCLSLLSKKRLHTIFLCCCCNSFLTEKSNSRPKTWTWLPRQKRANGRPLHAQTSGTTPQLLPGPPPTPRPHSAQIWGSGGSSRGVLSGGNLTWKVDQRLGLTYRLLNSSMADPLALKLEGRDPFFARRCKKGIDCCQHRDRTRPAGEKRNSMSFLAWRQRIGKPVWRCGASSRVSPSTDCSFYSHCQRVEKGFGPLKKRCS